MLAPVDERRIPLKRGVTNKNIDIYNKVVDQAIGRTKRRITRWTFADQSNLLPDGVHFDKRSVDKAAKVIRYVTGSWDVKVERSFCCFHVFVTGFGQDGLFLKGTWSWETVKTKEPILDHMCSSNLRHLFL